MISWLSNLHSWAQNIAQCLRAGGRFYIAELHPFSYMLGEGTPDEPLQIRYPYLTYEDGQSFEESGSYADRGRVTQANIVREWSWGLGDVVTALLSAGLKLIWLREHSEGFHPATESMTESDDGHY